MSKNTVIGLLPSDETIHQAAAALAADDLVIVPTETVYGAAAVADSEAAVEKLLLAKERPPERPLPVMAPDATVGLTPFAEGDAKRRAQALAAAFWPGPLTIVAPLAADAPVSRRALAGHGTVGVRVPSHPVTQAILKRLGRLVVCPSANRSDAPPAVAAAQIDAGFLPRVALVMEDDARSEGQPSTVVDVSTNATVLREGPVSLDQSLACLAAAGL